jgi:hypothetical protein
VVLPYIAEENQDEDPEVLVKPDEDNANAREVKEAIYAARGQVLLLNTLQNNQSSTAQVAYSPWISRHHDGLKGTSVLEYDALCQ